MAPEWSLDRHAAPDPRADRAGGPGRAAARHYQRRSPVAFEETVAGGHHHQDAGYAFDGRERRQCVPDHRMAGDALVLLGPVLAGTAAGAGAWDQGKETGIGFAFTG